MAILILLGGILLLVLIFGPQIWVQHVLRVAQTERTDLPGTGGELARHLLDEADLRHVQVEESEAGDHFDPAAGIIRLTPPHFAGRSIAAVAVAAHEVSHAVQHARGEPGFRRRMALIQAIAPLDRIGQVVLISMPLVFVAVRSPSLIAVQLALVVVLFAGRLAVHAVTLPVELDASFGKALPVLERGGYLPRADLPQARRVLRAAALTYVAAGLITLINAVRWFRP
jgi:hypothetical protein